MTEIHIPSTDYISKLTFDHFSTFSFHRTKEFLELLEAARQDFRQKGDETSVNCINLRKVPPRLTFGNEQFNPTAEKIKTFSNQDPESATLINILSTPVKNIPDWMCKPFYRDGIVFYKDNKIVSVLNICLECEYMQLADETYIDADIKTFALLRDFLKNVGHPIEIK